MSVPPTAEPREMFHVAIVRRVREGCEAEFQSQIANFFKVAAEQPGVCGAYLIRPVAGTKSREYGILRSFRSKEDMQRFYDSDLFRQWNEVIHPLVEGDEQRRELHGLEAFFRQDAGAPPRWKMAVITWIGVNPAVYIFSMAVPAVFGSLPAVVTLCLVNAFVVASLTWALMPALTKLFGGWLRPKAA